MFPGKKKMLFLAQLVCFGAATEYIKYEKEVTLDEEISNKARRKLVKQQKRHLQALAREWGIPHIMQIVEIWRAQFKLRPVPPTPLPFLTHQENLEIIKIANHAQCEFKYFFETFRFGKLARLQIQYHRSMRYAPDQTTIRVEALQEDQWLYTHYPRYCPYTYAKFIELPIGGKIGFSYKRHYGKCQECNERLRVWRNCEVCAEVARDDVDGFTYATCL